MTMQLACKLQQRQFYFKEQNMEMKTIPTNGISYIEILDGTPEWYWGTDAIHGDLYEAEELYRDHHAIKSNRLIFVHYPDGWVVEPIKAEDGQYFGSPVFTDGKIHILYVDFPKSTIHIVRYDDGAGLVEPVAVLPLSKVKDCYNLSLKGSSLTLVRQGQSETQIIWPEQGKYTDVERESLIARVDDKLYCCRWYENEDTYEYWEAVIIRKYPTCEVLEVIPGTFKTMPDGQNWILQ
jgi:hypothetical protein